MKWILVVGLLVALAAPVSEDGIIGYCDALGHIHAEFAVARTKDIDREALKEHIIDLAHARNRDEDDDNDITIGQEKLAFEALNYAYDHPELSPSRMFDTIYMQCKKDNRTLVKDGEVS